VPQVAQSRNESRRAAQQPFKPPMNFSVINYDSGKCIGEYLRMSDNLKRNLGGFGTFLSVFVNIIVNLWLDYEI
jgi:hypothetical protein